MGKTEDLNKSYYIIDGTCYDKRAPIQVCKALDRMLKNRARIRVFYGDPKTGNAWAEENNTIGYVGRTTGSVKTPLLLHDSRSSGGSIILVSSIVAITRSDGGSFVYKHPNFTTGDWIAADYNVYHNGELYARCDTLDKAKRLALFMSGKRNSK